MQEYFFDLADHLTAGLQNDEVFTALFRAEDSDFIRFNHGRVRQAGSVAQRALHLDLIRGFSRDVKRPEQLLVAVSV